MEKNKLSVIINIDKVRIERGDAMYELGEQFKFDLSKAIANEKCVFKGTKYRITVLTERLIRLEYNENGLFEDYPTERILYRNFPKPEFSVTENNRILNIKTKYFELNYLKEKKFDGGKISPSKNLRITLLESNKSWYYKHPEVRNFKTRIYGFNDNEEANSLYSLDGFASIDDSDTLEIKENGSLSKKDNNGIDIYVFLYGKDFYSCLNDYFMITGYPPLIPRYALGNWWSKEEEYTDFDITHITKKFEDNEIPISMFLLNNWDDSYEFNKNFKDPKQLIDYLHTKKLKVGLSINYNKLIKQGSPTFTKLEKYLNKNKNGDIPFNVYDERNIDAFLKLLIHPLDNMNIDFYSINTFNKKETEQLFILKHYLYYDGIRNAKRTIISSNNFNISSHRYPVLYSGKTSVSWETLKSIPSFNASATNMGISFWSHDIGGSSEGTEEGELFTRFIQLGVFSPIMRLGSSSGKYYKREPWKWELKVREITKYYLQLRHRLIPYLYTESYKYHKYGKPLIEPIYYRYPQLIDDVRYKDEYFFGSEFLISPIVSKKDSLMDRVIQKIYIPDGTWYDFRNGKKYNGNKKYAAFYRDEEYPIFVKAGSIIPMTVDSLNDTNFTENMEIQIFPGASNTYSIYEDDGETNNYLNEEYLITNIEFVYQKDNYKVTILPVGGKKGIVPNTRNYKIRLKNTKPTTTISSFVASKRIDNNYYKDGTDLVVEVKDIPTDTQFTLVCNGDNIEVDSSRIINEDIISIISYLPIKTVVKEKIDKIMFTSNYSLKRKRIEIRKLANGKNYIDRKYIDLLLKLLEYINEV